MNKRIIVFFTFSICYQPIMALSQTCPSVAPKTAPDNRFVINSDDTVSDLETGLVWKRCSEGLSTSNPTIPCGFGSPQAKTWQATLKSIQDLNQGSGFAQVKTWRLPNIKELESLVEWGCELPAINITVFPFTTGIDRNGSSRYWSSTTRESQPSRAWYLNPENGLTGTAPKITQSNVRLVYDAK